MSNQTTQRKTIDLNGSYCLRTDELEYEVRQLFLSPSCTLHARIWCESTNRETVISYNDDGTFVSADKPHALDLIEQLSWNTSVRDAAPRLIRKDVIYALDLGFQRLLLSVDKMPERLCGRVVFNILGGDDGDLQRQASGSKLTAECDGRLIDLVTADPFVRPAYTRCSTCQPGDLIMVRVSAPTGDSVSQFRFFLGYDQESDAVIYSRHAPNVFDRLFISPPNRAPFSRCSLPPMAYMPTDEQRHALKPMLARMKKSWF